MKEIDQHELQQLIVQATWFVCVCELHSAKQLSASLLLPPFQGGHNSAKLAQMENYPAEFTWLNSSNLDSAGPDDLTAWTKDLYQIKHSSQCSGPTWCASQAWNHLQFHHFQKIWWEETSSFRHDPRDCSSQWWKQHLIGSRKEHGLSVINPHISLTW